MTDSEAKIKLDQAVEYFEQFINKVLPYAGTTEGLEDIKPMDLMKNYNTLRQELAKLYVDTDV
jgi:hypothetical protein